MYTVNFWNKKSINGGAKKVQKGRARMAEETREEIEAVSAVYEGDMEDPPVFDVAGGCSFRIRIR